MASASGRDNIKGKWLDALETVQQMINIIGPAIAFNDPSPSSADFVVTKGMQMPYNNKEFWGAALQFNEAMLEAIDGADPDSLENLIVGAQRSVNAAVEPVEAQGSVNAAVSAELIDQPDIDRESDSSQDSLNVIMYPSVGLPPAPDSDSSSTHSESSSTATINIYEEESSNDRQEEFLQQHVQRPNRKRGASIFNKDDTEAEIATSLQNHAGLNAPPGSVKVLKMSDGRIYAACPCVQKPWNIQSTQRRARRRPPRGISRVDKTPDNFFAHLKKH